MAAGLGFIILACLLALHPAEASAQSGTRDAGSNAGSDSGNNSGNDSGSSAAPEPMTTVFPHSDDTRWFVAGQANVIFQWHPTFPAAYSGPNSLTPAAQSGTTHVVTLYTGVEVTHTTEVLVDLEDSTGSSIGSALGLAGETNLDAVRAVQGRGLSHSPYLARLIVRQIIPLSSKRIPSERGPLGLFTSLPERRIEIRVGKFSMPDFFDKNSGGSDSHLQFLNWTVDADGAWDYAANTRGYTDGAIIEYDDVRWSVRFAEALMPKMANGINLDADLARAHSETVEGEWRGDILPDRAGVVRVLGYVNHADMGNYQEAIDEFLAHETSRPDVIATREQGRVKYGFGVNAEQQLTSQLGVFARVGWNDGHNESFVYTEVDQTVEAGAWLQGNKWRRELDKVGIAFVSNAISKEHAEYLQLGGLGFLLGDGNLNYGRETIWEGFYNVHFWRGFFGAFDLQHIQNPGYNRDRGPVLVPALRLHVDF